MMTRKRYFLALLATAFLVGLTGCSDDDNTTKDPDPDPAEVERYVIVAASDDGVYLLEADDLTQGTYTIKREGNEAASATAIQFPKHKYAYRLVYNQGNPGIGSSYELDATGKLVERNIAFEVTNRFTTYGPYGDYLIMGASGATDNYDSGNPYPKYGVTFTYIDVEKQTLKTKTVVTENMTGNGEYYTISGIVEHGGKFYTALCPQGLSSYGASKGLAKYPDLVTYNDSNEPSLSPTQYPDSVWVAIYDGVSFENPKILRDDRLQYATSRFRSQFYSTIDIDDEGNIYVFSSSNSVSADDDRQITSHPSGAIRILNGADDFDPDYFCDIEALSGGCRLFKVWHVTGDYFLLQMFESPDATGATTSGTSNVRRLAILKAGNQTFRWVDSGIPEVDNTGSFGSFPCFEDGLVYMPVVTLDSSDPAIYVIDPATASAKKGATVTGGATSITAIGKLSNAHNL